MSATERRFSTGREFLDRRIRGGLVPGRLLALTAPPSSQSELLLAELASARRSTIVSTTRPETEIREWVDANVHHHDIDVVTTDALTLLEEPTDVIGSLEPESFLVLDSLGGLETAPRDEYLRFLNHLKAVLRETDSVGILHCLDTPKPPARRTLTLHRADYVWQLEVVPTSRDIKTRLLVTKARRGRALDEPIPLKLTDTVKVDTSRRI